MSGRWWHLSLEKPKHGHHGVSFFEPWMQVVATVFWHSKSFALEVSTLRVVLCFLAVIVSHWAIWSNGSTMLLEASTWQEALVTSFNWSLYFCSFPSTTWAHCWYSSVLWCEAVVSRQFLTIDTSLALLLLRHAYSQIGPCKLNYKIDLNYEHFILIELRVVDANR